MRGPRRDRERDGGVVIVGGGLAAQRCAETLRTRGHAGRIRMICGEPERPYDRPPLSKGLLAGSLEDGELAFRPPGWYDDQHVELLTGRRATRLRPPCRRLDLADGTSIHYEKLLIATGAVARRLPLLEGYENVHYLRTLADARRLREALDPGARLAVVGAGFIGQEVAATATAAGLEVTLIEALAVPLAAVLGEEVGMRLMEMHRVQGVDVRLAAPLESVRGDGSVEELTLSGGARVEPDAVVVGIGIAPDAAWLAGSGLEGDGVRVDAAGRAAIPGVFAAGDVARRFDPRLGQVRRSEHWDAASRQGAAAALAMLGFEPAPSPLPSFWSDQYGVRLQSAGHTELADDVRVEAEPDSPQLVAHYSRAGRPVGVLTVDAPREHARLRRRLENDFDHTQTKRKADDELRPKNRRARMQRPWRLRRDRPPGVRPR